MLTSDQRIGRDAITSLLIVLAGLALCVRFLGASSAAQEPALNAPPSTLRVTTRLVLVDVVVRDKHRKPMLNLTQSDFKILDNGKEQKIATFEQERPGARAKGATSVLPALPPHIYTNRPEYSQPQGPLTVLLLDALNTPLKDQSYAREEMIHYLKTQLATGARIAVFTLGQNLEVVQDFTEDPALLKSAVENFTPNQSIELSVEDVDHRMPAPPRELGESGSAAAAIRAKMAVLRDFYQDQAALAGRTRFDTTLGAFQVIARALYGYTGRKHLVWLTAAPPLWLQNFQPTSPFGALSKTYQMLADARVSIYPVDARGLIGVSVLDASTSGMDEWGFGADGSEFADRLLWNSMKTVSTQDFMRQMAASTGGLAFTSRNDLDHAVEEALDDGVGYYVMGFYPTDSKNDRKYHKVQVSVDRPGFDLGYRRGYFAAAPGEAWATAPNDGVKNAQVAFAMRPDAPGAIMVRFDARVIPATTPKGVQVSIDLLIDAGTLSSERVNGKRRYDFSVHVAAYGADGKLAAHEDFSDHADIKEEAVAGLLQQGFPVHTQIELNGGRYQLRIGVQDTKSNFLGTLPVELTLE